MFKSISRDRETSSGHPATAQPHANGQKRGMFSVVGPDMIITGNIAATADLHIDGRVDGDVSCGNLVQGPDSSIKGAVRAEIARLAGTVDGSVAARQITIERAARITGDVEYETIAIENGASIDGRLKHITAESARAVASTAAAKPERSVTQFPTSAGDEAA